MNHPITKQIYLQQSLLSQAMADIEYLLENYPEEEVRHLIGLLIDLGVQYRAKRERLSLHLTTQNGFDVGSGMFG